MRGARILARGRRTARERMSETVQIGVFSDGYDPGTGKTTRELAEERYTGPARVTYPGNAVREVGGTVSDAALQSVMVSIPSGSPAVYEADEIVVTASTADGGLAGRRYRVTGAAAIGQTTAMRIPVEELT